jgi:hypothetical protein
LVGLGKAAKAAIDVESHGRGTKIEIRNTLFDACGGVELTNRDSAASVFVGNTYAENGLVPVLHDDLERSRPAFQARGKSTARQYFQGNRIYRSWVSFDDTSNWLIGGNRAPESNIIVGPRAGIFVDRCSNMVVRLNLQGADLTVDARRPYWVQVAGFESSGSPDTLIEHNVFYRAHWNVRGLDGEFRYNVVLDNHCHEWIIAPMSRARVHHNIFARYRFNAIDKHPDALAWAPSSGFCLYNRPTKVEFYNNVVDCVDVARASNNSSNSIVAIAGDTVMESLRNNVFMRCRLEAPAIGPASKSPPGPYLAYADYNLFYHPDASLRDNYSLWVNGLKERIDDGFARNDLPAGGAVNAQLDPRFVGPLPTRLPFTLDRVKAGTTTVPQILALYRARYTPQSSSPLIDSGDPADGKGTDVGAVGAGVPHPDDRFGVPR